MRDVHARLGPPRLTLRVESSLHREFGAEIAWALRHLLATLGYSWRQLDAATLDACDIVYSERPPDEPVRLWLPADRSLWRRADTLRWTGTAAHPTFGTPVPEFTIAHTAEEERAPGGDVPFLLYWLAAGIEERHRPRNRHGHLDFTGTPHLRDALFRRAVGSALIGRIGLALQARGAPLPEPRWPDGKRAAFCCGHDVDYPEVVRWLEPARIVGRQGVRGSRRALAVATGRRHHWHFADWTALEHRFGLRSAFYFVGRQGSLGEYALGTPDPFYDVRDGRFRAVFRQIAADGGEIGTHASYHAWRDPDALRAEKERLEDAAGVCVAGNRHHYWHLDPQRPERTLAMHERVGYLYDASLAHERYLGWRRSFCTPFFPFDSDARREIATVQMPTAWMDDHLFGYAGVNGGDPDERLAELVDTTAAHGGCLVVDVHDYVFDEQLYPGWRACYARLLQRTSSRGDVWLATPGAIASYWTARYRRLLQASEGLTAGVPAEAA